MRYGTDFGFFEINAFPGCNQIAVSNHSWIAPKFRGKGLGTLEHKNRLILLNKLGYDYVLCTVKLSNEPQLKILHANRWRNLDNFYNKETGNDVGIYGKLLVDE